MTDRIEREVEELLARLEKFPPRRPWWKRAGDSIRRGFRGLTGGLRLPDLSAGQVLLIAIAVIVVAYLFFPAIFGRGSDITRWVIIGAIVTFIAAFVLSLRRQSRPPEKYWRDKPLDLRRGHEGGSWWDRWRHRR
jgi:hypothetical protein